MQSREVEYRKNRIEELENLCKQEAKADAIQFYNLKIQLMKGVDVPAESEKAKALFYKNQNDSKLLAFLLDEGIFSHYQTLYQCKELDILGHMSKTAGEYMDNIPAMGPALTGTGTIIAGFIGGMKGLFTATIKEPVNQTKLIEFFCILEKIRNPGPRKVFIQMVPPVSEKYLTASFKSATDIHAKWLDLLNYVTDLNNYGTDLYRTIIKIANAKDKRQDMLGFKSLQVFFKNYPALPNDMHEVIRDKFIELSRQGLTR